MLKTAVITGGHHYGVVAFQQMFRELPGIDAYPQHLADFVATSPNERKQYDVLVFYTHLKGELAELGFAPGQDGSVRSVLEALGIPQQGLVLLHHSILAFPGWTIWDEIVGTSERELLEYSHDEQIDLQIVDATHPVCAGLSNWTITDETYLMPDIPGGDNHVLITTAHSRSMTTLAWARHFRSSRVVCLQPGHDEQTWHDHGYRQLLTQAVAWAGHLV